MPRALAALATLAAPGILASDNLLSMNAFEPLFWMGCAWLLIRIVKTGNQKLWIWLGVLAGFGLENKYSMLIFGAGIVFGLLLTPQRRVLASARQSHYIAIDEAGIHGLNGLALVATDEQARAVGGQIEDSGLSAVERD